MGYVGNQTTNAYTSITKQDITGDGGTAYTLDHAVANANEIEVFVNNVRQEPSVAYTVSGTALTMTGNVAASDDFYVVFQGKAVGTVVPPDDSVTTARINDGAVTNAKVDTVAASKLTGTLDTDRLPSGSILQVQYKQFTGTSTTSLTANTEAALTDLTVNITPKSTSSKILIQTHVFYEHGDVSANGWNHVFFFYRDNTKLSTPAAGNRRVGISMGSRTYYADDDGSTPEIARFDYFDEPNTTSQVTYKVGISVRTSETFYLNRCVADGNNSNEYERGVSFISVTEIAG